MRPEYTRLGRRIIDLKHHHDYLRARLAGPNLSQRFLQPPIYGTRPDNGMATVYTAIYRPTQRCAVFRWPGRDVAQGFDAFTETEVTVDYRQGEIATVTT